MVGQATEPRDRRIQRTQKLLASALIALTLEKGYAAVTIRDITERADVGYATFFRHYGDKDALLDAVLDVFIDELMALLHTGTGDDPAREGTLIFRYVQEHHALCRVLLHSPHASTLLRRARETGTASALGQQTVRSDSSVPPDVVAHHLVVSAIGLIQWWLDHDMPYSPEHMGTIYRDLIIAPIQPFMLNVPRAANA